MNFNVYDKGCKRGKKRHDENTKRERQALAIHIKDFQRPDVQTESPRIYRNFLVEQEDVGMGKAGQALRYAASVCTCVQS